MRNQRKIIHGLLLVVAAVSLAVGRHALSQDADPAAAAAASNAGSSAPDLAPVAPAPTNNVSTDNMPPAVATPAPQVSLSSGATELTRLAQSGLGEDVMLAYVANVNSKFNLGSDQIVYLNDLGISGAVVKAMIERDAALQAAADIAAANLAAANANPNPPATGPGVVPPPPADAANAANPPDNTADYSVADDSDYFYNSLAPYGNWIYMAGYGVCWQPTVCVGNRSWHPYNDRGRWVYSDSGWYWQSDYSWGWAAFHYGRWFNDTNRGWVWMPDHVWAPAWVSWRQSADYCGWAPLPPAARFTVGVGFTYANHLVGAGFEFGLQAAQYTFIPIERLSDYTPARYAAPSWQAGEIQSRTVLANHFTVQNRRVVNQNIDPAQVAALSRTEIRRAEIREVPRQANRPVQPDRLTKSGGTMVILRPQLPAPTARRSALGPAGNPSFARTSPVAAPATQPNVTPRITYAAPANAATQASADAPILRRDAGRPTPGFNFNGNYNRPSFNEHLLVEPTTPTPAPTTYVIPSRYTVAEQLSARPQNYSGGVPSPAAAAAAEPAPADAAATQYPPGYDHRPDGSRFHPENAPEASHPHSEPAAQPAAQPAQRNNQQQVESAARAAAAEHYSAPAPAPSSSQSSPQPQQSSSGSSGRR